MANEIFHCIWIFAAILLRVSFLHCRWHVTHFSPDIFQQQIHLSFYSHFFVHIILSLHCFYIVYCSALFVSLNFGEKWFDAHQAMHYYSHLLTDIYQTFAKLATCSTMDFIFDRFQTWACLFLGSKRFFLFFETQACLVRFEHLIKWNLFWISLPVGLVMKLDVFFIEKFTKMAISNPISPVASENSPRKGLFYEWLFSDFLRISTSVTWYNIK